MVFTQTRIGGIMTETVYMKGPGKDAQVILVNKSQVEMFKSKDYKVTSPPKQEPVEKPVAPVKHGPRFHGAAVELHREGQTCQASPNQVEALEKAGWSVSEGGSNGHEQQQGNEVDQAGQRGEDGSEPRQQPERSEQPEGGDGEGTVGSQRGQGDEDVVAPSKEGEQKPAEPKEAPKSDTEKPKKGDSKPAK